MRSALPQRIELSVLSGESTYASITNGRWLPPPTHRPTIVAIWPSMSGPEAAPLEATKVITLKVTPRACKKHQIQRLRHRIIVMYCLSSHLL